MTQVAADKDTQVEYNCCLNSRQPLQGQRKRKDGRSQKRTENRNKTKRNAPAVALAFMCAPLAEDNKVERPK